MLHCLAVAREFDMHRHWNRFVTDSCTLACPALWDQLCYVSGWAPYPLPQFDLVMRGRAYDLGKVRLFKIRFCYGGGLEGGG